VLTQVGHAGAKNLGTKVLKNLAFFQYEKID
jgi:hypothetical protein